MWDYKEDNLFVYFSEDMGHDSDNGIIEDLIFICLSFQAA